VVSEGGCVRDKDKDGLDPFAENAQHLRKKTLMRLLC
jgi:hypothetical protein